MASWVADLERAPAARRPPMRDVSGAAARASPARENAPSKALFHFGPRAAARPPPPASAATSARGSGRGAAPAARSRTVETRRESVLRPTAPSHRPSRRGRRRERRSRGPRSTCDSRWSAPMHQSTSASDARLTRRARGHLAVSTASARPESCSVALKRARRRRRSRMPSPTPPRGRPPFGRTNVAVDGGGRERTPARRASNGLQRDAQARAGARGGEDTNGARRVARDAFGLRRAEGFRDGYASGARARVAAETAARGSCSGAAGYAEETTARLNGNLAGAQAGADDRQAAGRGAGRGERAHRRPLARVCGPRRLSLGGARRARSCARSSGHRASRADKAEATAVRHKEAVAKLTADNMVFLMRLKESETAAGTRAPRRILDARRARGRARRLVRQGAPARVERVVQNAMRRAESAVVASRRSRQATSARQVGLRNARLRRSAQNESLAARDGARASAAPGRSHRGGAPQRARQRLAPARVRRAERAEGRRAPR